MRTAPLPDLAASSVEQLFVRSGALLHGHFLLKSGRHTDRYLEKFMVLQHPALTVEIGRRLAEVLAPHDPPVVVGPTTGGVLLAHETARQLEAMLGHEVRGLFAEPLDGGGRALRRGWPLHAGERAALVDDVLTTGASLVETADAVRAAGLEPTAAAVMVDRSTGPVEIGCELHVLGRIEVASWPAEDCALCRDGVPLVKPGSSV